METVTYNNSDIDKPTKIQLTDIILVSSINYYDRRSFDIFPFEDNDWESLDNKGYATINTNDLDKHYTELPDWLAYIYESYAKVLILFTSYDILKTAVDMYDEGKIKSLSLIRISRSVANSTKGKRTLTQTCNENLSTAFHSGIELR
jgi:hypothetical protein